MSDAASDDINLWVTGGSGKRYWFDRYDKRRWKEDLLYEGPKNLLLVVVSSDGQLKRVFTDTLPNRKFLRYLSFPAGYDELVGVTAHPDPRYLEWPYQDLRAALPQNP